MSFSQHNIIPNDVEAFEWFNQGLFQLIFKDKEKDKEVLYMINIILKCTLI